MTNHQSSRSPRRRRSTLVAIALLMTLFAAACSSGTDVSATTARDSVSDTVSSSQEAARPPSDADDAGMFEPNAGESGDAFDDSVDAEAPSESSGEVAGGASVTGVAGSEATAQLPDLGRDIIYTATLEIGSTDVSAATRDAIRSVEGRGGFLFAQETRGGAGGTSVLTFKILPDQFQAALNDLGSVGTVRSQSISADDVSAVVVDLESRINTAEASVVRLRNLLDDASALETIATLENQLLQRETTLEQLRGQLRTVRNQVDLATITLYLTELLNRPSLAIETMAYAGHDAGFGCFDSVTLRTAEAGDAVTICYRLVNTGDTPLVDVRLDDPVLGATLGSVVVVDGTPTQIEPGESLLLAQEVELSEPVRLRTSATATGLDADGNELEDEVKATAATLRFDVLADDDGLPSFGEVLEDSWSALVTAALVIALVAVAVLPFAVLALVLGVPAWLLIRRRRAERVAARPAPPTPPAPPVAEATEATGPADAATGEKAATTS